MRRCRLRADDANRLPRLELRRQLTAFLIVREGTQVGICLRFENEDTHGSVFAAPRGGFWLVVGVVTRLFSWGGDQTMEDCFLAGGLTGTAHRFAFLASRLLGRLFVKAPSFHFTKHALTLHFLFQNAESLIDIVVAHKNLQIDVPLSRGAAHTRNENPIRTVRAMCAIRIWPHTARLTVPHQASIAGMVAMKTLKFVLGHGHDTRVDV